MIAFARSTTQLIILAVCLILPTTSLYQKNCHYTCTYCKGSQYDQCIYCQEGLELRAIKNTEKIGQLYYNWLEDYPSGSCLGAINGFNVFGVAAFSVIIIMFIWLRNRTMFYFLNTMQTFALFSLIEVGYSPLISYLLQGFEDFMFVSTMMKLNKQKNLEIFNDGRYRMYDFLHEYNFQASFLPVFICSSLAFLLAFLAPICKHFAKNQNSIWTLCTWVNMRKALTFVEISSICVFFFLIQETVLIIVVGVFLNSKFIKDPLNIGLVVAYALLFVFMMVNICSKNMDLFGNKALEQIEILKKCLTPIFIIMPVNLGVVLPGFIFLIGLLGLVFNRIKPAERTLTDFHKKVIKRQFIYRLIELLTIGGIIAFWFVENEIRTLSANMYAGIAAAVMIGVYLLCLLVETGIVLYGKYYKKQDQRLYGGITNSVSSMRQSRMEETLENFQTTEEGIMDMIFFGRNFDQKESPKKNHNIQLNLDHLNEQIQQHPEQTVSKSATTSPKNRDFKNRTSRTPKHDRSSRFKLTKVSEPQNKQLQIEYVDMDNSSNRKSPQSDIPKSQRSQNYPQVKTGRKQKSSRRWEMEEKWNEDKKSPRFGVDVEMKDGFYKQMREKGIQCGFKATRGKSSLN